MQKLFYLVSIILLFSCKNNNTPIVSSAFIDSLIVNYDNSKAIKNADNELGFWKNRIQSNSPDLVNELKYAAQLVHRFHILGSIDDVRVSDSILTKLASDFNSKEAAPFLGLVRNAILMHQFQKADSLLQQAINIGIKPYDEAATTFDVSFELGRMLLAETSLQKIKLENDFGYQFRKSKWMHYKGELDSSIAAMQAAAVLAGSNNILWQSATSNLADLYIHNGDMDKAYKAYTSCIKKDAADLHSLMGIGNIALLHDNNHLLAEKIFQFVTTKTKSPDPLYKLIGVAEQQRDTILQKKRAIQFERLVAAPAYGAMYNKYLIQLYTGILNNPATAENIAFTELKNRNTPQTNAWYAYSLLCNGKKDSALMVYEKKVSGKPLEGLELYFMGKLMKAFNKGYNAKQFFTEAKKNKYDLSSAIYNDIEKQLKE